ncbi:pyridoxal phosphate-dependent transferase [Melanogaster broomeanus]|nr:pyridoxal phosphate-dependent transferase [Melanogaster broomeanus]
MDIEQFRRAGYHAIDHICDYYYTLQNKPVASQVEPGYLRKALPPAAPQTGEDFKQIAEDYQKFIIPGLMHWQHPSFFAYFPTASTFEAILGDLYANGIGPNPGFNWSVSPACTELEAVVMDWAAQILGLDKTFYNSSEGWRSASDSVLVAVATARSRYISRNPEVLTESLVLYTTTQTHSLGKKAGLVLGLNVRALEVTSEDNYALRGETLQRALTEDRSCWPASFHSQYDDIPLATVGTTSSGAIDRLGELGEIVAKQPSLWLHVDAAWAGVSLVCPEYRELCLLDDINQYADSFCTNFHKARGNLTNALDVTPEFLRSKHGDEGTVIDYRNWHLGLGRRFRSLKLWFVLRSFGVEGFRRYIRQTVKHSDTFVSLIRESSQFKLVTPPCLALSVFRLEPPASEPETLSLAQMNTLNMSFYARLSTRPDIALTRTDLNGTICIRMAVGAERTSEEHIRRAFEVLCEEANVTLELWEKDAGGQKP